MVYKIFQKIPLKKRSCVFQLFYGFLLFLIISYLNLDSFSFIVAFLFSNIYMLILFSSAQMLFQKGKQSWAFGLFFFKWIFLLCVLLLVYYFLDGVSFLIGLSAFLSWIFLYILEQKHR